jgi:hypothetical protein
VKGKKTGNPRNAKKNAIHKVAPVSLKFSVLSETESALELASEISLSLFPVLFRLVGISFLASFCFKYTVSFL